MEQLN